MSALFENKVAIVTGGASGIGEAISVELAARGAKVVVADMNDDNLKRVVGDIEKAGGTAAPINVDVSDYAQVEKMVQFAQDKFGALDMAVNNAGVGGPIKPVGEYPLDAWRKVIDVNLNGVFYSTRAEIEAMVKLGGGSIVNMASMLGSVGFERSSAYVAAKHGVLGLTKNAAIEYAQQGIRVNSIGPGFISTPLVESTMDDDARAHLAGIHAMNRMGTPKEVANLTCFLLSDEASFITGSYHLVDGGATAK